MCGLSSPLARKVSNADKHSSSPQVILTSVCPGPVKTELSRSMQENSVVARIAAPIFMTVVGKSPDYGARIYITAALAGPKDHVSFQNGPQEGHRPWRIWTILGGEQPLQTCLLTSLFAIGQVPARLPHRLAVRQPVRAGADEQGGPAHAGPGLEGDP